MAQISAGELTARTGAQTQPVLIALHDSIAAHTAVPAAISAATALQAEVVVVIVVHPVAASLQSPAHVRDLKVANTLLEVLRAAGLHASLDVRVAEDGSVAPALLAATEERQPSLLVMGSHSRREVAGLVAGSVLHEVVRSAICPVLVVPVVGAQRFDSTMLTKVVLAVDASESSDHAAAALAQLAKPGAEVLVLHVHEVDLPDPDSLSERVSSIVQTLELAGLQPTALESHALPHAIPETILDISRMMGAGLIVVGNPGRSDLEGLLRGSVTHKLLHQARCPVLIVH